MSIESCHLILCHPLLFLSPIPPSIRVFSNESTLRMRWPKDWSFSFMLLLLLQEAGGGWCIKGEAPPNRVSSPRTLSPAAVVAEAEAAAALCCSGAHAAANPHLGSQHPAPQVDVKSLNALFRPPSPPSATQLRAAFTPAPRVPYRWTGRNTSWNQDCREKYQ